MQPPWTINSVVQSWAQRFLVKERHAELLNSLRELQDLKRQFESQLSTIPGICLHAGAANFLLVELVDEAIDAYTLYRRLGHRGLLVRVCDSFRGMAKGRFIRLAVRTASENSRLTGELSAILRRIDSEGCI